MSTFAARKAIRPPQVKKVIIRGSLVVEAGVEFPLVLAEIPGHNEHAHARLLSRFGAGIAETCERYDYTSRLLEHCA